MFPYDLIVNSITTERSARRAAILCAAADFDAGLFGEVEAPQAYATALLKRPGQTSEAWVNAQLAARVPWIVRPVFLNTLDTATTRLAREYLEK